MSLEKKYTEEELVLQLQQQNKEAFSFLYDHYAGALHGIIFRLVGSNTLSEDILQEVFVKIWKNVGSYDSCKGSLFTWMKQIARNLTIDTMRSKSYKKQLQIYGDENSVDTISDTDLHLGKTDAIGMDQHLRKLKPEYFILIDLFYFKGYTQTEAAEMLGIPLGTIKTRLRKAILELKNIMR